MTPEFLRSYTLLTTTARPPVNTPDAWQQTWYRERAVAQDIYIIKLQNRIKAAEQAEIRALNIIRHLRRKESDPSRLTQDELEDLKQY